MKDAASRLVRFVRGALRNSPWLVIAVGLHVIAVAALAVVQFTRSPEPVADSTTQVLTVAARSASEPLPPPPEPELRPRVVPKQQPFELSPTRVDYVPQLPAEFEPDLGKEVGDPSGDASDGPPSLPDGSSSIGVGQDGAHRGSHRGSPFGPRGTDARDGGGGGGRPPREQTEQIDASVLAALRWLCRHQRADGSWGPVGMHELCTPGAPCIPADAALTSNYDEGLTGLALLCFLGAGHAQDSKAFLIDTALGERHEVGRVVARGLSWLVKRQAEDGAFSPSGFMYDEALATMALSEAYGMTGSRYLKAPAQRGVEFLVRAQKKSPQDGRPWGWRYGSAARLEAEHAAGAIDEERYLRSVYDADVSVTCWTTMALKSARMSRLEVPESALQGALEFARAVATEDGRAGYLERAGAGVAVAGPGDRFAYHAGTLSALDMLVRTFVAHDLGDPYLEQAAKRLAADLPSVSKDRLSIDYYYWYHGTLALNQFDGEASPRRSGRYWKPWNAALVAALLELQQPQQPGSCASGGWLVDDRWSHAGRALYNTALNTLTLEVYHRYPNAFGAGALDVADTSKSDRAAGDGSAAEARK